MRCSGKIESIYVPVLLFLFICALVMPRFHRGEHSVHGRRLSVRLSVCPVHDPKSKTEAENWQEGSP